MAKLRKPISTWTWLTDSEQNTPSVRKTVLLSSYLTYTFEFSKPAVHSDSLPGYP